MPVIHTPKAVSPTAPTLQRRFLTEELGSLSLHAALATRSQAWPVYATVKVLNHRGEAKDALRVVLDEVEAAYAIGQVLPSDHTGFIEGIANRLSRDFGGYFFKATFRFGVAQKLVNLHLKYLWVAGLCPEPPHCPIDGIIRDHAGITYNWTSSNSSVEYDAAVVQLQLLAGSKSLAQWELEAFERRRQ